MKHDVACERASAHSTHAGDLSHGVLVQAAARLGGVAVGVGSLGVLAFVFGVALRATGWEAPTTLSPWLAGTCKGLLFLASLGVWHLARRWGTTTPRRALDVGFAYQVLGAVLLATPLYWGDHHVLDTPGVMGWLGVWIVLFPLVIPAPPGKTLVVASLSATLPLAVHAVWVLQSGASWPPAPRLAATFTPYYFCAVLAAVPAWYNWRLNQTVCDAQTRARELGSYQLQQRLGAGGMGEVWRAEHRMLARPAAIKLIKADFLSGSDPGDRSKTLARFEREAKATAALQSPHTVELYDFGVTNEGTLYYVMELLQGVDLETLVSAHGPLPPARAVYLLRQACASLAEAHAAGMIHRDIKPANLFLCRLGLELDFVKVLDFGLVRSATASPAQPAANLTGVGHIVGTPAFMAPEQAERGGEVDPAADIYSLGCVAYWLLTGKAVFQHDSAMRILVDHIKTPPQPPSTHLPEPLPAELEGLVMACLAKNPLERPSGAEALAEQLAALPLPAWTQADARAWWRANLPQVLDGQGIGPSRTFDVYASTVALPAPDEAVTA